MKFLVVLLYLTIVWTSFVSISPQPSVDQSSQLDQLIKLQEKSLSYDKASYELLYFVSEKFVFVSFVLLVALLVYLISKINECCCYHSEKPSHTYTRV